jgi:chromosome segregation ATPase
LEREYYCTHDQSVNFYRKEIEHNKDMREVRLKIVAMQHERKSLAKEIFDLEEKVATLEEVVEAQERRLTGISEDRDAVLEQLRHHKELFEKETSTMAVVAEAMKEKARLRDEVDQLKSEVERMTKLTDNLQHHLERS